MRGSGSGSGEERKVPCRTFHFFSIHCLFYLLSHSTVDFRILEERRESPVFEDGSLSAPGKFEATCKHDTSRSNHHPLFPAVPTAIPGSTDSSGVFPITTRSLPATSISMQGGLGSPQEEGSVHSRMFFFFLFYFFFLSYFK